MKERFSQFEKIFAGLFILLCSSSSLMAESSYLPNTQDRRLSINSYEQPGDLQSGFIVQQIWGDFSYLANEKDFYLIVGGIAMAPSTFGSFFQNESPEFTKRWGNSPFADKFFEIGEVAGDAAVPFGASITAWGIGKISDSKRLREFGSDLFRTQALNGIFTIALKGATNRTRPDGTPHSYPSGHASSSFATAGVIYTHFGRTLGIPAFVFAGYVGLSRLQEGRHYASDVIAGAILGGYVSLKLSRRFRGKSSLTISPFSLDKGLGMSMSVKF